MKTEFWRLITIFSISLTLHNVSAQSIIPPGRTGHTADVPIQPAPIYADGLGAPVAAGIVVLVVGGAAIWFIFHVVRPTLYPPPTPPGMTNIVVDWPELPAMSGVYRFVTNNSVPFHLYYVNPANGAACWGVPTAFNGGPASYVYGWGFTDKPWMGTAKYIYAISRASVPSNDFAANFPVTYYRGANHADACVNPPFNLTAWPYKGGPAVSWQQPANAESAPGLPDLPQAGLATADTNVYAAWIPLTSSDPVDTNSGYATFSFNVSNTGTAPKVNISAATTKPPGYGVDFITCTNIMAEWGLLYTPDFSSYSRNLVPQIPTVISLNNGAIFITNGSALYSVTISKSWDLIHWTPILSCQVPAGLNNILTDDNAQSWGAFYRASITP